MGGFYNTLGQSLAVVAPWRTAASSALAVPWSRLARGSSGQLVGAGVLNGFFADRPPSSNLALEFSCIH